MTKKTMTATLLSASLLAMPVFADNKPLKGNYNCKGTGIHSITINGVGGGNKAEKIKGKIYASRGNFLLSVSTPGLKTMIDGYLSPDTQKFFLSPKNDSYKNLIVENCSLRSFSQDATGSQNKSGKTVTFVATQTYSCAVSDAKHVETYNLTCKR